MSTNKRRAPKVREGRSVIQGHTELARVRELSISLLGAKRTLTNRCLPISIYEYTAFGSQMPTT